MFVNWDDHRWIVLSDPDQDPDRVVLVYFTSYRAWLDQSCVVEEGEHPFVRHRSMIAYADALVTTLAKLQNGMHTGAIKLKDPPLSAELLARVRERAEGSDMPLSCVEILRSQGLTGV